MAKPKLCLIPAAQGSKLFSVLPSSGVGDFDFTRSSSATRINSQGLIETVASGVSRLNYPMIDGKVVGCPHHILENSATNLVTYSEDFSQSYWTKSGATVTSGFTSPDGTNNAYKLVEGTNNGSHQIYSSFLSGSSGNNYTTSFFVKAAERTWCRIMNYGGATVFFDLANGVVGAESNASGKIEALSNGWYKISSTYVSQSNERAYLHIAESNNTNSYQGNGTSGIYVFGAQVEQGSYPTSYIPTNGSAVTRSAETANGSGDAATFNDSEGVLMIESSLLDVSQDGNRISISDGSSAENRITFRYLNDNETQIELGLTNGFSEILNVDSSESFNKIAVVYNSTNASVFINGFNLVTDTMSSLSGLSQLQFNRFNSNTENFYGNTKQLQYYNSALTDSELETLTSWVSFSDMANGQLYTIE